MLSFVTTTYHLAFLRVVLSVPGYSVSIHVKLDYSLLHMIMVGQCVRFMIV
jgi:hypothetical protein